MAAAKDILRIGRDRLIRLWVGTRLTPDAKDNWIELGHFLAGFDLKLTSIKETDGLKRDSRAGVLCTGSYEAAQNAIADFQSYVYLLDGTPRPLMILFGHPFWPDRGKLLVLNWVKNADKTYQDNRVSVLNDPLQYSSMLSSAGTITGFVASFDLYRVTGVSFSGGSIHYTAAETLRTNSLPFTLPPVIA